MSEKLKIVGLKMENIKRIEAVELQFDEKNNLIEITGANGEGKSSLLDGLKFLFSGAKGIDPLPVRNGAEKGLIEAELKKYAADGSLADTGIIIQKKFNPSGTTIKIYKKGGVGAYASSQQILDTFYDAISFDPLAFAELSKTNDGRKKQVELLKKLTGLTFDDLDKKYKETYDKRTELNRQATALTSKLAGKAPDEKMAGETTSAADIIAEIQKGNELIQKINIIQGEIVSKDSNNKILKGNIADWKALISDAEDKIASNEASIKTHQVTLVDLNTQKIDIDTLNKKLSSLEASNEAIRANNELKKLTKEFSLTDEAAKKIDAELEVIKMQKQTRLSETKMPIPGMSFTADGISINGIPFEQVNDADKLKTSVAMAMSLNPVLRVILIRNGSLLDHKNYQILKEMAQANDYTIFLERVDESGDVGIVIEEGKVLKNNYEVKSIMLEKPDAIEQTEIKL